MKADVVKLLSCLFEVYRKHREICSQIENSSVENVIHHSHPKEDSAPKDSREITISWFPNQFSHTLWGLCSLHPSQSYATCHIPIKHCTNHIYRRLHFNFWQNYARNSAAFNLPAPFFTKPFYSTLPSLTCSAPPVLPAPRPDHSSVLHKALACRWKGVYSRIRQLLYMPQWLRNVLLPHSRTGSNTSISRLQRQQRSQFWTAVWGSYRKPHVKMFTCKYFEVFNRDWKKETVNRNAY